MSFPSFVASIQVAAIAVGVSLVYALGTRLLTNVERTKRLTAEVSAFQRELREAITKKEKAKEEKLRKKEASMRRLQGQLFKENIKPTLLFTVPLLLVWYLLLPQLLGAAPCTPFSACPPLSTPVADSPIPLEFPLYPLTGPASAFKDLPGVTPERIHNGVFLWSWYLISSFSFATVTRKLLRLT